MLPSLNIPKQEIQFKKGFPIQERMKWKLHFKYTKPNWKDSETKLIDSIERTTVDQIYYK